MMRLAILILCGLYGIVSAEDTNSQSEGHIHIEPPKLSKEEENGRHMPDHLKCDTCMAIAYQLYDVFEKLMSRAQTPREYEVIEVTETLCMEGFEDYGLKSVNNVNRLSGPGLKTDKVIGMIQLGGIWPHRIREMCHNYLGEVGEMTIFEASLHGLSYLQKFLCFKNGVQGECKKKGTTMTEKDAGLDDDDDDHFEL